MKKVSVRAEWGHLGFTCGSKTCISILWGHTTVLQTLTGKCLGPTAANPRLPVEDTFQDHKEILDIWTVSTPTTPQSTVLFYACSIHLT